MYVWNPYCSHFIAQPNIFLYTSVFMWVWYDWGLWKMLLYVIHFTAVNARKTLIGNNSIIIKLSFVCSFPCLNFWPDGIVRLLPEENLSTVALCIGGKQLKGDPNNHNGICSFIDLLQSLYDTYPNPTGPNGVLYVWIQFWIQQKVIFFQNVKKIPFESSQ